MRVTLGGERLGSGKKMQVDLRTYDRSTHDLSFIWRSSMAAGTIVPFMNLVSLPGDTWDIDLEIDVKTHPTIGPLFGSYKVQADIFEAPLRLYNSWLHNNKLGVGLNMAQVKLPLITMRAAVSPVPLQAETPDNSQINPSCLLAYLGIRGVGYNPTISAVSRQFNAVPLIMYWDIYKNYYANKQEEIGAVIHTEIPDLINTVVTVSGDGNVLVQAPSQENGQVVITRAFEVEYLGTIPLPEQIMINTTIGRYSLKDIAGATIIWYETGPTRMIVAIDKSKYEELNVINWDYITDLELIQREPEIATFPLSNIDTRRETILATAGDVAVTIDNTSENPYNWVVDYNTRDQNFALGSQEGLGLKTYQSDIFNNWLKTEWIDGPNGVNEVTAVDTSGGSFTIDQLLLARKVYDMLNGIAVSGGSYDDWVGAVYQENKYMRCMSPVYHGGLSKELEFQEVVSNAAAQDSGTAQPLGTLAGKGVMSKNRKGGGATIKPSEPGYIMGLISITPRIDYSQGNAFDIHFRTMDDFHKPALDQIGFQDLITEKMVWWDTNYSGGQWVQKSAGKQPAWLDYMTNFNKTYGNFAIAQNEMFMTLNRRYEWAPGFTGAEIGDLTTYVDPSHYNQIFAQTSLDSQNFWVQVGVNITCRRLMSAKIMPNM